MPTLNPRLSVTLTPELASVLERMSQLTNQSRSAIVSDILETTRPVFERLIQVLEAAQTVKGDLKEGTIKLLQDAESKLHTQLGLSMDIFNNEFSAPLLDEAAASVQRRRRRIDGAGTAPQRASARSRTGGGEPALPPHVTRGSGILNRGREAENSDKKVLVGSSSGSSIPAKGSKRPSAASKQKTKG